MHSQDPWLDGGKGKRIRKSVPGQEGKARAAPETVKEVLCILSDLQKSRAWTDVNCNIFK